MGLCLSSNCCCKTTHDHSQALTRLEVGDELLVYRVLFKVFLVILNKLRDLVDELVLCEEGLLQVLL